MSLHRDHAEGWRILLQCKSCLCQPSEECSVRGESYALSMVGDQGDFHSSKTMSCWTASPLLLKKSVPGSRKLVPRAPVRVLNVSPARVSEWNINHVSMTSLQLEQTSLCPLYRIYTPLNAFTLVVLIIDLVGRPSIQIHSDTGYRGIATGSINKNFQHHDSTIKWREPGKKIGSWWFCVARSVTWEYDAWGI